MQYGDEYEQLARRMDVLTSEFHRTHDENIKAEIWALASQMAEITDRPHDSTERAGESRQSNQVNASRFCLTEKNWTLRLPL